jgi:hypothetical protein
VLRGGVEREEMCPGSQEGWLCLFMEPENAAVESGREPGDVARPRQDRLKTSYTMWSLFRNCRKAAQWRYIEKLVPLERDRNLRFGSLVHECLELWHRNTELFQEPYRNTEERLAAVLAHIETACSKRSSDDEQRRMSHLATAMMKGYAATYPVEAFEVVALEMPFEGEITSPKTGAASRSFVMTGKIDGLVRQDGKYYLFESKTAATIDASYLEKLWTDFQIILYAHYVEQTMGIRVAGVIYNILTKAKLQQSAGETEAEFEARRAELIAKSKTGRSSAKRRMPETDDEFQERLAEKYTEPGMFHRELIYLSRERFDELRGELWELTQAFLDARRRGVWYQNTSYCFQFGRPCPYFALCSTGGNPNVRDNFYRRSDEDPGSANDAEPVTAIDAA